MTFVKTFKVLLSVIFFQKDLEMMFYNVLNRKKGFLHYKNVILTKCENVRFSKGLTHDFREKFESISEYSISLKKTYTWCLIIF